jgi:hypothetical protein
MEEANLTEEQKLLILKEWNGRASNPPSLLELTKMAFPSVENIDGRSKEGRAVKAFLATRQIKARGSHEYQYKEKIELSPEQKEYAANNASMMKAYEIARILFNNPSITHLSQESKSIHDYIKSLGPQVNSFDEEQNSASEDYRPPKTEERMISRINKYVLEGVDKEKLTAKQKKDITSLIGYLHSFRFIHQINSYGDLVNRELFESSFVRYTYDKNDLTQEEVDQYIVLSTEAVISSNIQKTIQMLQNQIDTEVQSTGKIPMTLVEASNTARTEYNQSVNRQQKLLNDLKEKRSDRLKNQIKENASILNLVQLWKEEESRVKLIKLAELKKQSVKQEVERLTSLDEIKCRILGLSEDEATNG